MKCQSLFSQFNENIPIKLIYQIWSLKIDEYITRRLLTLLLWHKIVFMINFLFFSQFKGASIAYHIMLKRPAFFEIFFSYLLFKWHIKQIFNCLERFSKAWRISRSLYWVTLLNTNFDRLLWIFPLRPGNKKENLVVTDYLIKFTFHNIFWWMGAIKNIIKAIHTNF